MKIQAPVFDITQYRRHQQQKKQQQKRQEPLPWNEGEPEMPQPPFLPAA